MTLFSTKGFGLLEPFLILFIAAANTSFDNRAKAKHINESISEIASGYFFLLIKNKKENRQNKVDKMLLRDVIHDTASVLAGCSATNSVARKGPLLLFSMSLST